MLNPIATAVILLQNTTPTTGINALLPLLKNYLTSLISFVRKNKIQVEPYQIAQMIYGLQNLAGCDEVA